MAVSQCERGLKTNFYLIHVGVEYPGDVPLFVHCVRFKASDAKI
jgi:hypothetical protein